MAPVGSPLARSHRPVQRVLLECFQAALEAVDGRAIVARQLRADSLPGTWRLAAVGKAAAGMSLGALDALDGRISGGVIVAPQAEWPRTLSAHPGLLCLHGGHPMPDERSLAAGEALREAVLASPVDCQWLVLVSGGASALLEDPVPGVGLQELRELNSWALAAGLPIGSVNRLRRRCSRLKGGGLADLLGARRVRELLLSDVAGDDPRVIGSGLLHPPPAAEGAPLPASVPRWWSRLPERRAFASPRIRGTVVGSVRSAAQAAAERARMLGWLADVAPRRLRGDATRLGRRLAREALRLEPGRLRVWGGESTVRLPEQPGRGGRNQQLALSAALALAGRQGVALLAAGTDGIDGASEDAGALVDGGSCARARDSGRDPQAALRAADAGTALEASGDLLHTGPTGTNVGDLVIAIAER